MARDRTELPEFVLKAIQDVEDSELTDMTDRETVLMFAAVLDHGEAAEWLVERRHLYPRALFAARAASAVPISKAS